MSAKHLANEHYQFAVKSAGCWENGKRILRCNCIFIPNTCVLFTQ